MDTANENPHSILDLLNTHRLDGATSWDLPSWGELLGYAVYPLFIFIDGHFEAMGTAFCISQMGIVATASHNIIEAKRRDRGGRLFLSDSEPGSYSFKDVGLSILHAHWVNDSRFQVKFRPAEVLSTAHPTDVMFGFQKFSPGAPCWPLKISFSPPRIGSKVICLGYSAIEPPAAPISLEDMQSGRISDWFSHYQHRFSAVEGHVTHIFTQNFAAGYLEGPCFAVDAEVQHGQSGGPVFNEDGWVCGVVSAGATEFFGSPYSLVSLLYPSLMTEIKLKASEGPILLEFSKKLVQLIEDGSVKTDGTEELVAIIPKDSSFEIGLTVHMDVDVEGIFDNFRGFQDGAPATTETRTYRVYSGKRSDE